MTRRLLW